MSIPILPLSTIQGSGYVTNVQPFTYRDGETYLRILERMRQFINTDLVQSLNDALNGTGNNFAEKVDELDALILAATTETEADLTASNAARVAAEAARDLSQTYANTAGEFASASMLAVFNNLTSTFRVALEGTYATDADVIAVNAALDVVEDALATGRLSISVLDGRFNAKASVASVNELASSVDSNIAAVNAAIATKADAENSVSPTVLSTAIDIALTWEVGTFTYGSLYQNHPSYAPLKLERKGNRVRLRGVATINQTVSFLANTAYVLGTIPSGWRPAPTKQAFGAASVSPNNPAWIAVDSGGDAEFNLLNASNQAVNALLIGINLEWDLV